MNTGFRVGDLYTGNGKAGQIVKITNNGNTVINPWVTLPGENGLLRGNLWIDETGVWGGNMIVSTTVGDVWEVTPSGTATELAAAVGGADYWEGLTTIPNNPTEYGPLAGTIMVADEKAIPT